MNLFEKIFNYQIMSRLEDSGTIMITAGERAWLRTMLQHPSAPDTFSLATLNKLNTILEDESSIELSEAFIEKARSQEKPLFPPQLRELRHMISARTIVHLTYTIKNGRYFEDVIGFPYKLEYSMVKREWYLLWYQLRNRALFSTKLQHIVSCAPAPDQTADPLVDPETILHEIQQMLEKRKQQATIEIGREYNRELSRILYAFSCFEKEVDYDDSEDTYRIRLTFHSNESEYVLSKIRFLGKRVKVIEGKYMRSRMLESATRALGRYVSNPN